MARKREDIASITSHIGYEQYEKGIVLRILVMTGSFTTPSKENGHTLCIGLKLSLQNSSFLTKMIPFLGIESINFRSKSF